MSQRHNSQLQPTSALGAAFGGAEYARAAELQESLYGPGTLMTTVDDIDVALNTRRPIAPIQLRALYDSVGWWPERPLGEFAPLLADGSAVGAWHRTELVAFARAVSDSRFRAYVEDVVVRPEYRRKGIATCVLELLLEQLRDIDVISLFCSDEHVPVYERSGFVRRKDVVMHRYRRDG